jgi:hypothetical protein
MGLRLFFFPNFSGATFIQGATFIPVPDSRVRCLTPSSSNSSCTELPLPPPLHYGKLSKSFSWSLLFASGIIFNLKVRQSCNDFFKLTIVPEQTNEFNFTTMIPQVNLFLFVFGKKSKTPKNCFEMNSFQLSQNVSPSLINPSGWCG